jgi:hypothetical protein
MIQSCELWADEVSGGWSPVNPVVATLSAEWGPPFSLIAMGRKAQRSPRPSLAWLGERALAARAVPVTAGPMRAALDAS